MRNAASTRLRPAALRRLFAACAAITVSVGTAQAIPLGANPEQACSALVGEIPAAAIGLASGPAVIDKAAIVPAVPFAVAERALNPAARITPATPSFCRVLGHIKSIDSTTPNINLQVNLPLDWDGRSLQYGGGGFNGFLVDWVEHGKAPGDLVVTEQSVEAAPKVLRARPLCQWPTWPKYKAGDVNDAKSFECTM